MGAGACGCDRKDGVFMNLWLRLNYVKRKLDEAILNGKREDILYWQGYRDGVLAALRKAELKEDLSDGALE